jgi:hypothetical protein
MSFQNELQAMNKGLPRHILKLAQAQLEHPFAIYFQDRNDDQGLDKLSGYGQDGLLQLIFAAVKGMLNKIIFSHECEYTNI